MSWPSSLHTKHALLLGLAFAGAIPYGLDAAASLLAGGGVQVIHLKVLERGMRVLTDPSGSGARALAILVNLMRFALLLAAVLWVLTQTPVRPLAFGIGLVLAVPAAAWQGLDRRA